MKKYMEKVGRERERERERESLYHKMDLEGGNNNEKQHTKSVLLRAIQYYISSYLGDNLNGCFG